MRIKVERKSNRFYPDATRTILRTLHLSSERCARIIDQVLDMSEPEVDSYLNIVLHKFAIRHRNVTKTLQKHFEYVKQMLNVQGIKTGRYSHHQKLLIGAYFTMEYSMESAAFFNPSIVAAPDQFGLIEGQTRVIVSFRSIGEGHISSIVFRTGIIDSDSNFEFQPSGDRIEEASIVQHHNYNRNQFARKLREMKVSKEVSSKVLSDLGDEFVYHDLKQIVNQVEANNTLSMEQKYELQEVMWLADSHYDIHFSLDTDISERVIFPISESERNGIEDARFVKFNENGKSVYYATYTAYDGHVIMPKLLETHDFYNFKVRPIHGEAAENKNLALFPRKIDGKYAMLSRIDGVNNYLSYSENLTIWENPVMIQQPKYPWEFVQIGNCGSPIETKKGWLVITHGVGPLRTYCLGASLFDLNDPSKELGRLEEPLLVPRADEMEGYVPNVVYSCGSIECHDTIVIPYGMSDYGSGIITVPKEQLLSKIMNA
ncbi:MAG: glycoside hydrolase family 130 protein [Cyclobacteriaceae bacterium]